MFEFLLIASLFFFVFGAKLLWVVHTANKLPVLTYSHNVDSMIKADIDRYNKGQFIAVWERAFPPSG